VEVLEYRRPVLGINSLGRIGKLTLWHHIGRKYFQEIVVNVGRGVGAGLSAIAQVIEKDATYGTIHRFLRGVNAERMIRIVDEKRGALLIDGIPVTILPEAFLKTLSQSILRIPVVHAKIFGWYDNEYGSYTNRLGDLTTYIHQSLFR
jgi:glyceraldehyde-3-phosphate dehydrogenase/erythrose-4-phosphate dehydrogenase